MKVVFGLLDLAVLALRQLKLCVILLLLCCHAVIAEPLQFELKGVEDSTLKKNIRLHLGSYTQEDAAPTDPDWQNDIINTVDEALAPYGYYNSETLVYQEDQSLFIEVTLGTPLVVSNITREIIGEGRDDKAFREKFNAFPMQQGDVLVQPTYESFKSNMFNYALSHGFFDFTWQAARLDLVRESREANVLLIAQSGPQYYFGEVELQGDTRAEAIINRLKPFRTGDKYSSATLTEFNRRLNQTGYFARVIARPLVSKAGPEHQVPVEIRLEHLPRDIFNVGGGADTDTKGRVRARWERPWVNSRGHSMAAELYLSQPEQSASIDYRIPMKDVNNDYASIESSYEFDDNTNTDTQSETLSVSGHRYWSEVDSHWRQNISLTYAREIFSIGNVPSQSTHLLMPGYAVSYTDSDNQLDVSEGQYYLLSMQAGHESVVSDISLFKANARTKWITTLLGVHRLMIRSEIGAIMTNDFDQVPASIRYFAGGDQSVRGFAYESLSPRVLVEADSADEEDTYNLTGGKYLATASVEYAYPVSANWRAAVFADIGTATNDFSESPATGIGIGAHWLTMIGPVRFYIARGNSDFESTWRFHFTLGPEL